MGCEAMHGPCPSWSQTPQDPHCPQDKPSHPSPPTCDPVLLPSLIPPALSLTLSSTSILTRPQSFPDLQVCAQAVPSAWNPSPLLFPLLTLCLPWEARPESLAKGRSNECKKSELEGPLEPWVVNSNTPTSQDKSQKRPSGLGGDCGCHYSALLTSSQTF